ncbi:hypothetical protein QR90_06880 [Deinococcus radiopugnans]|uniref:Ig-like domain (Group 3) n=1 Tax=Deinococcus radiopugnans TaxID=57497 RepID=A0A0A7KFF4_9DEIO|nr:Ig-like domain-containing protein [Deinococcus radiopugnans]AIZ44892.1 hypothetical protein QR90_06880 [Deinococcus radiopugnans]
MRRLATGFALTSLALALASCGSSNAPVATQPASAGLVKFQVAASSVGGISGQLKGLGLSGTLPSLFFNVQVRDANNQLVAFNGGTFDPTGQGSKTLVLDGTNDYRQTLLLPAGTYTFENAAKDTATSDALLAYGPAAENSASISGDSAVVRLKFHAVFDKANSALNFSMSTARLFTNSTFNLSLRPMTSPVGALQAAVPTTDIGPVTYALGNPTDGVLNGGSKIGVNVTARGTSADSLLNVTASFNAWVRNAGTDTASFVPTSLDFTHNIETNVVEADMTVPEVAFDTLTAAFQDSAATLSGTATDDVQVEAIRVYANSQLVASTDAADGVGSITTATNGAWSAQWTPAATGSHELSVVVSDSSGNEFRVDQSVTVALRDFDLELDGEMAGMAPFTIPANGDLWVKVNRTSTGDNHVDVFYQTGDMTGLAPTFGASKASQTAIPNAGPFHHGDTGVIAGSFYVHLTNATAQPVNGDISSSMR